MRHTDLRAYLEMVQDAVRVGAYKKAIDALCPGKVVLDLGAGPGILSHLALAAGAKKVFAVDQDPRPLQMAAGVVAKMGAADRFVTIAKRSRDVTRADLAGEQAEVLVSETMDVLGTGEGICESMADAMRRLCVRGAISIPRKLDVSLSLGGSAELANVAFEWGQVGGRWGLPYDEIISTMPTLALSMVATPLTRWTAFQSLRIGQDDVVRHSLVPFWVERAGHADAILAAWRAELADGVVLSTFPEDPETHWKQGVVTICGGFEAAEGGRYVLEMVLSGSSTKFSWAIQDAVGHPDPRVHLVFGLGRAMELTK